MATDPAIASSPRPKGRANRSRPKSVVVDSPGSNENDSRSQARNQDHDLPDLRDGGVPADAKEIDQTHHQADHVGDESRSHGRADYYQAYIEWRIYAEEWSNKYRNLHAENETLVRNTTKLSEQIEKLQVEALNSDSVDRFQPDSDEIVIDAFAGLTMAVGECVNLLCKLKSSLSSSDWEAVAMSAMREKSFDPESGAIDHKDRFIRRMAMKNVVWHFLDTNVLNQYFPGYFGPEVEVLRATHRFLYPEPRFDKESAKWRTMSAARLEAVHNQKDAEEGLDSLLVMFKLDVAAPLGYDNLDEKVTGKVRIALVKAIAFARRLARQRAFFELVFPNVVSTQLVKIEADKNLTNLEDDDDNGEERPGKIWFISRPALVKSGNGLGDKLDVSMTMVRANVRLVDG